MGACMPWPTTDHKIDAPEFLNGLRHRFLQGLGLPHIPLHGDAGLACVLGQLLRRHGEAIQPGQAQISVQLTVLRLEISALPPNDHSIGPMAHLRIKIRVSIAHTHRIRCAAVLRGTYHRSCHLLADAGAASGAKQDLPVEDAVLEDGRGVDHRCNIRFCRHVEATLVGLAGRKAEFGRLLVVRVIEQRAELCTCPRLVVAAGSGEVKIAGIAGYWRVGATRGDPPSWRPSCLSNVRFVIRHDLPQHAFGPTRWLARRRSP